MLASKKSEDPREIRETEGAYRGVYVGDEKLSDPRQTKPTKPKSLGDVQPSSVTHNPDP